MESFITHNHKKNIDVSATEKRLREMQSLTLPLEETLALFAQLNEFELGRFLLKNKGLNGFWTAYIIIHAPQKALSNSLERWVIEQAPVVKATRQRFAIFQQLSQSYLKDNMCLASAPCGLMDDLLSLEYGDYHNISLVGIDLDEESLKQAKENAILQNKQNQSSFLKRDAWCLDIYEAFDLLTSNGLNIYEPDDEKVTMLYKEFYQALKPNGILITSFLTPPPTLDKTSTWKNINLPDILKQKALFADILQVQWQAFRTEATTRKQLEDAGFEVMAVHYDDQGMFPTVVARK